MLVCAGINSFRFIMTSTNNFLDRHIITFLIQYENLSHMILIVTCLPWLETIWRGSLKRFQQNCGLKVKTSSWLLMFQMLLMPVLRFSKSSQFQKLQLFTVSGVDIKAVCKFFFPFIFFWSKHSFWQNWFFFKSRNYIWYILECTLFKCFT